MVDKDGLVKPVLLIILEELYCSGIEEICLIVSREDKKSIEAVFDNELSDEHRHKISPAMLQYENKIRKIGGMITFAYQNERLGFGHAVYQSMTFSNNEPVLLVLGDHLFSSTSDKTCAAQAIEAFDQHGGELTVMICEIPVSQASNYGVVSGSWLDHNENLLQTNDIVEKPTPEYARENLSVSMKDGGEKVFSLFGQYVLTPDVYRILGRNINKGKTENGEYQLTSALKEVMRTKGMLGFVPNGKRYDTGNPSAYMQTIRYF
ncbi:MAG: UTP--glucose-1-phosphate uridylyltransferase [Firmicutes bacterium]|nr:UTP--glucose-1-phosphate uridylyltransferase [Bacillota bacterium]